MIKWFRVLFGYDPPIGKWISYPRYVMEWRSEWQDRVKIVDYDKENNKIKLGLIDYGNY